MRAALGIVLFLAALVSAVAADKPLPQDKARIAALLKENLDWNRQTLGAAYERVGKKDPRWDAAARKALELAALHFSQNPDPLILANDVYDAARKAVDAGCDDPMILYVYARLSTGSRFPGQDESVRRMQRAGRALDSSRYPAIRRATGKLFAYEAKLVTNVAPPAARIEAERTLEAVLDLLAISAKEDPRAFVWYRSWFTTANSVVNDFVYLGMEYKDAYEKVDARLAKIADIAPLRKFLKGVFYMNWGWQARTNAVAAMVSEQQFRDFQSRLEVARTALEEAWKLKHDLPLVAEKMLAIEKSIGGGDRRRMELWFERAMATDPNDHDACWGKLDWLDPKWHGESPDEMIAFGRACKASGNWITGINMLAIDAYSRYSAMLPAHEARQQYLGSPVVWGEIREGYEQYLKRFPERYDERSRYAYLCYAAGHYDEANRQFEILGDKLTPWQTFPNVPLAGLKQVREVVKRAPKARPAPAAGPAVPDH
ncbi:MAG: hypothetical protein ACYC61_18285 [Isosphaeraceae bacterium]